jgi:uncharacterized protein
MGVAPALCIFAPTCGHALVMEHNGDLYSCDHFVEPKYLIGNIGENCMVDLVNSEKQQKFGHDKKRQLPEYCRRCEVRSKCQGGCPKKRIMKTPDGEEGLNYLCEGYKAFFNHIDMPMKIMVELLNNRQAPARIMEIMAQKDTKDVEKEPGSHADFL